LEQAVAEQDTVEALEQKWKQTKQELAKDKESHE
jgi:hypothetical protein